MARQRYQDPIPQVEAAQPRPMFKICFALMGGIVYAAYFPVSYPFFLLAVLALSLCCLTVKYQENDKTNIRILMLGIAFLLGALRMEYSIENQQKVFLEVNGWQNTGKQTITGTVEEISVYQEKSAKLVLNSIEAEKWNRSRIFPGKAEIWSDLDVTGNIKVGNRIEFQGELLAIEGPKVPLRFNYRDYRYSNEIFAQSYLDKKEKITIIESSGQFPIRGLAYQAFDKMQPYLPECTIKPQVNGLIASMCLGLRASTPPELQQALIKSGLAHLTSISGVHVSIVLSTLAFALKLAGLTRRKCALTAFAAAIFYMLLVGYSVPTLRSILMAYVFFGAYFTERRFSVLNSLGLSAVIILLLSPKELFLPSFQLSYTAVLLLFSFQPLDSWLRQNIKPLPLLWLCRSVAVSAIVSVGMIPFTLYFFQMWSWGAILSNLAAIPISTLLLPVTYIWLLSAYLPIPFLPEIMGLIVHYLCLLLLYVIHFFADYPIFYINLAFPGFFLAALFLFAFLLLCSPMQEILVTPPITFRMIHLSLFLMVLAVWNYPLASPQKGLQIHCPSLGQGDCTLIKTPEGGIIIVDGGPPPGKKDPARNPLLVDYLLSLGVTKIDMMILSHPQNDHIGCLKEIIEKFPVAHFIEGVSDPYSHEYQILKETLESRNVPIHSVCAGDLLQLGGLVAWILNPTAEQILSNLDMNDKSIVLLVKYGNTTLLLPGDIGKNSEKRILEQYQDLHTGILKVPHHGSRESNSLSFVQAVKPDFGVIEVGKNSYGHPHEETRKNYVAVGTQLLRVDYDGTIQITATPHDIRLYSTRTNRLYIYTKKN